MLVTLVFFKWERSLNTYTYAAVVQHTKAVFNQVIIHYKQFKNVINYFFF